MRWPTLIACLLLAAGMLAVWAEVRGMRAELSAVRSLAAETHSRVDPTRGWRQDMTEARLLIQTKIGEIESRVREVEQQVEALGARLGPGSGK